MADPGLQRDPHSYACVALHQCDVPYLPTQQIRWGTGWFQLQGRYALVAANQQTQAQAYLDFETRSRNDEAVGASLAIPSSGFWCTQPCLWDSQQSLARAR